MGAAQSDLAEPTGTQGYHILAIQPDSPAAEALLEEYFDYIVTVNGAPIVRPTHPEAHVRCEYNSCCGTLSLRILR